MKRGLYQGCFPTHINMDQCLAVASKLGFDGFEIAMEDSTPLLPEAIDETTEEILAIGGSVGMALQREGSLGFNSSTAEISNLARHAAEIGIRVHSIATMMLFFYPLSSPIASVREKGIGVVVKMLETASLLGADTILIVPGLVTPTVGYEEVYRRSKDVIRDLETEARRLGVVMAIENVWNRFLLSPMEMVRYIDELGSPYVGVYFDVANILTYGYPADWLRILGPRVKGVHFKDFRKDIGNILGFTHLLHGDVNWTAVNRALREISYQGYITVEVPPLRAYSEKGIKDARDSLDLILEDAQ